MSKQSDAKAAQGYEPKPIVRNCGSCAHFKCEIEVLKGYFAWSDPREIERNKRCGIGSFAIKKTATCALWLAKASA